MSDRTFVILGDSGHLAHELQGAFPTARIIQARCLERIPPLSDLENPRVLVGRGTVPVCCVKILDRWIADASPSQAKLGAFKPKEARRVLKSASDAWRERANVLAPRRDNALVNALIAAAKAHNHEWFTVHEASYTIGMSVRQIRRIIERETGCSPHVLLHLARIVSIAREIENTEKTLKDLADSHQFADTSSMSRQFKRFVGQSPGEYRRRSHHPHDRIGHTCIAERVN